MHFYVQYTSELVLQILSQFNKINTTCTFTQLRDTEYSLTVVERKYPSYHMGKKEKNLHCI